MNKFFSQEQQQSLVVNVCAFCAALLLLALLTLVGYIVWRGVDFIWPKPIYELQVVDAQQQRQHWYVQVSSGALDARQKWFAASDDKQPYQQQIVVDGEQVVSLLPAENIAQIALLDGRTVLAEPLYVSDHLGQKTNVGSKNNIDSFFAKREEVNQLQDRINNLLSVQLTPIHQLLAEFDRRGVAPDAPARLKALASYSSIQSEINALEELRDQYTLTVSLPSETDFNLTLSTISGLTYPSGMSIFEKLVDSTRAFAGFLSQSPKQANTAGGVFPALFGTVVMVFVMTLMVVPFGVLTAVYLHEYAPQNALTQSIRIGVSNMAAVPSIVYGVFGLGFLVYQVGGSIDGLFFEHLQPTPTLGTPGLLWAALTMALLTLPVVIVTTEEGLNRVPNSLRKGSYALGATKIETVWHTVLPIASPSIMTGMILAVARAAGEVAPLMLVGAVRFAPNLPLDGEFPYLHLDRQFMHLGVFIYDGAFHSQINSKGASMMFAACSLLLIMVLILNFVAVILRNRLRARYQHMDAG